MTPNMEFQEALALIKKGHRLSRSGWNGKDMFVFLVEGSTFAVNRAPLNKFYEEGTEITYRGHLDLKAVDGTIGPWVPSSSDLLADDWYVVA